VARTSCERRISTSPTRATGSSSKLRLLDAGLEVAGDRHDVLAREGAGAEGGGRVDRAEVDAQHLGRGRHRELRHVLFVVGEHVLVGGRGVDFLTGGTGRDTFLLADWNGTADRNVVTDFARGADQLDLDTYGDAYNPRRSALSDFVQVNRVDADTYNVLVDPNGNRNFATAFVLDGVNLGVISAGDLLANGDLIM
jgi:hypothetical protein